MEDWTDPEVAQRWDADNTSYNPTRLEQVDMMLKVLEDEYKPGTTVLDVGMGSGQVEKMLFERVPGVRVVGTDFSEAMLALAQARLEPFADRYEVVRQDLRDVWKAQLPDYDYGIAFSVQVIHNVAQEYKKDAIDFVYKALSDGGLFLLLDRIRVSTPTLFGAYLSIWSQIKHREGATFEEHEAMVLRRGDLPATLEEYLDWMREAGFREVAVLQLFGNRVLIAARK